MVESVTRLWKKRDTTYGRIRGEHEFIWPNGAIMEPLCSVKSHEITTATSESVQYTAERECRWAEVWEGAQLCIGPGSR